MTDFSESVAIVTGASSGIGEAIAIKLATQGSKVTLCGRDLERLGSALDKCVRASGGHEDRFITVAGDVTTKETRERIVRETVSKFGRVDILVANAGMNHPGGTIQTATEDVYDQLMDTNLKAVFFLIQAALPELEKVKGNIVNVSSVMGSAANGSMLVCNLSKAGISHLTRCLALDLGKKGVRVNGVEPSFVPTSIVRHAVGQFTEEEILDMVVTSEAPQHPLYGRCPTPEEVADAVCFLASKNANFITGQLLAVDGGRHFTGMHKA